MCDTDRQSKGDVQIAYGERKLRESNIELLRIILTFGVIIMHIRNITVENEICNSGTNFLILKFLDVLSECAVDTFILITGYFSCKNYKFSIYKPVFLLMQLTFFRIIIWFLRGFLLNKPLDIFSFLELLLPKNYYVILFCVLILFAPFINIIFRQLTTKGLIILVCCLFGIFSVYASFGDLVCLVKGRELVGVSPIGAWGNQHGYTITNFLVMYVIGAFLKINEDMIFNFVSLKHLFFIHTICIGFLYLLSILSTLFFDYNSPLIVLDAVFIFLIFKKINIGKNKYINEFAKGCFTTYLLHPYFLTSIPQDWLRWVLNRGTLKFLIILLSGISIIFITSWVLYLLYNTIFKHLFTILEGWLEKFSLYL